MNQYEDNMPIDELNLLYNTNDQMPVFEYGTITRRHLYTLYDYMILYVYIQKNTSTGIQY